MRNVKGIGGVALAVCVVGCAPDEDSAPAGIRLEPVASVDGVPLSLNNSIVARSDSIACVIDSYEKRVHCGGHEWHTSGSVLGGEGEGPGEFRSPFQMIRGPRGELGVLDGSLQRLTIFPPAGDVQTVPLPFMFTAMSNAFDDRLEGNFLISYERDEPGRRLTVGAVEISAGTVEEQHTVPHPDGRAGSVLAEDAPFQSRAARAPDGSVVVGLGRDGLGWFDSAGEFRGRTVSPRYQAVKPSERDVQEFVEGVREAFGPVAADAAAEEFRQRTMSYLLRGSSLIFDHDGRLWVGTNRDRIAGSYLDVFDGPSFLAAVPVSDRLLGFDIYGSTLVVLAERAERDQDGMPIRGIDWYRIVLEP